MATKSTTAKVTTVKKKPTKTVTSSIQADKETESAQEDDLANVPGEFTVPLEDEELTEEEINQAKIISEEAAKLEAGVEEEDEDEEDIEDLLDEELAGKEKVGEEVNTSDQFLDSISVGLKKKIAKATLKKKHKIYRDDVNTHFLGTKRREDYLDLVRAARARVIKTGRITSITVTEHNMIMANITSGVFTVYIPATFLFEIPESILKAPDVTTRIKDMANRRLNTEVDYLVTKVLEDERKAYASRLDAMSIIAKQYYRKLNPKTGMPLVTPGDILDARVVGVSSIYLTVEVCGAETMIPQSEISYNRLAPVNETYQRGDIVKVKILTIEPKQIEVNGRKLVMESITASVKQAGFDPREIFYDDYEIGQNVVGVIKQITDNGMYITLEDKLDAYADFSNAFNTPEVGTIVTVHIDNKRDATKFIHCYLLNVTREKAKR